MQTPRILACTAALCLASLAPGQDVPHAFVGATILPIESNGALASPIEHGVLVVHHGKVVLVAPAAAAALPADAVHIDATGKVIMPGLVDTHNHIGGIGGADGSGPIQPGVRVSDSINPFDSGFRRAVAGGLTTLNVMPGSGHLLSGQTVYLKLRGTPFQPENQTPDTDAPHATVGPIRTIDGMVIRDEEGRQLGGIKMANGTNSLRQAPPWPGTRAKSVALVREQFIRAQEYRDKLKAATGADGTVDPAEGPPRDLGLEALVKVLNGEWVVHHHTHRADDIISVLRLKQEFGFRVVLHHTSEAWKVADEIAKAGVPCSIINVDAPGGKLEASDLRLETGAVLEKAGVRFAYHTDDWINDSRLFLRSAALGVRSGVSREAALRALTIEGARMLDLDRRIGSLEPGKDADFVLLSGDPFSVYTKVEQTWVEGVKVFDRANPVDRLHATGGFGAGHNQEPYFCCFGQ